MMGSATAADDGRRSPPGRVGVAVAGRRRCTAVRAGADGRAALVLEVDVSLDRGDAPRSTTCRSASVPGEIVGVAGVSGNGQTELVERAVRRRGADVRVDHRRRRRRHARRRRGRLRAGLGRITEDRRGSVVPELSVEQNLVLEDLDRVSRRGLLDQAARAPARQAMIADFDIRARPTDAVAACPAATCRRCCSPGRCPADRGSLVAAQPTRGLDVGAYAYVHERLRELRDAGAGVLLISEDLDELRASPTGSSSCSAGGSSASCPRPSDAASPRRADDRAGWCAMRLVLRGHEPRWLAPASLVAAPSSSPWPSRRSRSGRRRQPAGGLLRYLITPLTSSHSLQEVLLAATPLLFTGLAVAIAFRAGYYNIGAEGQFLAGAIGTTASPGLSRPPTRVALPLGFVAGCARRAAVGVAAGLAEAGRRHRRSGHDAAAQPGRPALGAGSAQRAVAQPRERLPRLREVRAPATSCRRCSAAACTGASGSRSW